MALRTEVPSWLPLLLLYLTLVVGQYSPTPCTDEVFDQYTGVTVDVVAKGEVRALSCQISSQPFLNSSSDRVRLSYCINGEWDQQNVFCTVQGSPNIVFPTTCNPAPPQPTGTSLTLDMTTKPLAQVYECEQGKAWLSRHGYRLTQCVGSTWTPIMDACEDDCGLPRDCSHPTIRALNTTGEFMVVPSGFYKRHAVKVHCEVNTADVEWAEGGWTTISMQKTSWITVEPTYDNGYFIGIQNLTEMNREVTGDPRPLVLQVLLRGSNGKTYHATYDNLVLDESHRVVELGTYHGDAGDSLQYNINETFSVVDQWWISTNINASKIGNGITEWPSLLEPVSAARVRIRPQVFDRATSCPPFGIMEPSWLVKDPAFLLPSGATIQRSRTENATVSLSRGLRSLITYQCWWFYSEGVQGGARTRRGAVHCRNDNGLLNWDKPNLHLPCSREYHCSIASLDHLKIRHHSLSHLRIKQPNPTWGLILA
ncbi:uncharacterized protein LOC121875819 [Homarus americanus]|uniref:uncharacterized protein LOC121875819 n=1 Tax=Homarus americanus TaxID=6706 RepID=UPI001C4427EA|nr:uncharacterized protein LOC121875819 [Homarus americanus]